MKNLIKILLIYFFLFSVSYSAEKIAFVDIDFIINSSEIGKKLNQNFNEKIKKEDDRLKQKEKDLKSKEDKILNQKNVLSEDELNKLLADFKKEISNFQQERISINNKFRDQKLKETNSLVTSLNNILANYAEKNSISLIIQKKNIVIGKSELDITKDVLDIFNSEIKSISN